MPIKVIRNRVFDGNKTYEIGDVIKGLSKEEESQLVKGGIADYHNEEINYIESKKEIDELKVDSKLPSENGDTDLPPEEESNGEENQSDIIDPNSLALNPDEYVEKSATKGKKGKANA